MRTLEQLAAGLRARDGASLAEAYARYRVALRADLVRRGLSRADADDAIQESFVKLCRWGSPGWLRGDHLSNFLFARARWSRSRVRFDLRRDTEELGAEGLFEKMAGPDDPEANAGILERIAAAERILLGLTAGEQEALVEVALRRTPIADLARRQGNTKSAVYQHLYRGRRNFEAAAATNPVLSEAA